MDSRQRALAAVTPRGRIGVELGPLDRPLIRRADGHILYADHLSTEGLARKYAGHAAAGPEARGALVEIDLVLADRTLAEALGARGPVDYIVASHVIEHLPDPIGWLCACAEALREDGVMFLAVPDKRFTFDRLRHPTSVGELIGQHLAGARVPSPAQVYEHFARSAEVDARAVWAGGDAPSPLLAGHGPVAALAEAREALAKGQFRDVHCTVFTPESFLQVFAEIVAVGLIPFTIADFMPTRAGELEFYALLRKRATATPAERAASTPPLDPRRPQPGAPGWFARARRR